MQLRTNPHSPFTIDASKNTLELDGSVLEVGGRGLTILQVLLEANGAAVSKEDLLNSVWPDCEVGEANLSVQIAALRKALGPKPDGGEWIVTVPRVGYRMPKVLMTSGRPIPTLAVVPFADLTERGVGPYFAEGVVEDIITALSRFTTFAVLSRTASFELRNATDDVTARARSLGVDYLLTGSFRHRGDELRLTIQLVEAKDGHQLLTDCHDGRIGALFEFQDRVVETVAGFVEPGIKRAEIRRARRKPPATLDSYDLYLQALPHFRGTSAVDRGEAIRLLEMSVAGDPDFPIALAHAAWAYERQDTFGPGMSASERQRALELAERALIHGDDDPLVRAICALVLLNLSGEWERSLAMLAEAERRCPHHPTVVSLFGFANVMVGDVEDGRRAYLRALEIAPGALDNYELQVGVAIAHLFRGEFEDSISWSLKALAQNGEWFGTYWMLVAAYAGMGRLEHAAAVCARLRAKAPLMRMSDIERLGSRYAERFQTVVEAMRTSGLPD